MFWSAPSSPLRKNSMPYLSDDDIAKEIKNMRMIIGILLLLSTYFCALGLIEFNKQTALQGQWNELQIEARETGYHQDYLRRKANAIGYVRGWCDGYEASKAQPNYTYNLTCIKTLP